MTCKDHDSGCKKCMIHPPRQPHHILPSKYADQICHAVIKPQTITVSKAQKYSNTYQMFEQRGNFNGINTCSMTQFCNFKLLSYLLQQNELRSLKGRPDINELLTQFVHEKDLCPEFANDYCELAQSTPLDIENLSYGSTYVPIDVAIDIGVDKTRNVLWDNGQSHFIMPCFPTYIYPLQACNRYGCAPHSIPVFKGHNANRNTSMLWLLSGILIRVQEIWLCTYNMTLDESKWNGWLLLYLAKTVFHHLTVRQSKYDPFSFQSMSSIVKLIPKLVSILIY